MDLSTSDGTNLESFLGAHALPCYAYVTKEEAKERDKEKEQNPQSALLDSELQLKKTTEQLYLIKTFECDCIFARSYSTDFEKMLMNQRSSFANSCVEDFTYSTNYLTLNQKRKDMISEEIAIPYGYQGLFEWFCVNSQKAGGILDHETDIISLASRFKKPACYYLAEELNVYEIKNEKTSSILNKYLSSFKVSNSNDNRTPLYNRKWTKLSVGTIVKATRVCEFDCFNDTNPYLSLCQAAFCCQKSKNKSEMVIEFQVVENFDELLKNELEVLMGIKQPPRATSVSESYAMKDTKKRKSFYIPVDVDNPNKSINLIPISPINKNVIVKNSLQTIKNFENFGINLAEHPNLEVKIFADNLFPDSKNVLSFSKDDQMLLSESCKMNIRLELSKFSSIYEAYENKKNCKILVGYNIDQKMLFFTDVTKACQSSKFKLNSGSPMVKDFQKKLNLVHTLSDQKVSKFNFELNKMETFNENLYTKTPINNDIFKLTRKHTVSHFADLINCDFRKGSISQQSFRCNGKGFSFKGCDYSKSAEHLADSDDELIGQISSKKKLVAFKLKKYHSLNELNDFGCGRSVVLSQDLIDQMNGTYTDNKFVNDLKISGFMSVNEISSREQNGSRKHSGCLVRARSRSLPSILVADLNSSCWKKNIL